MCLFLNFGLDFKKWVDQAARRAEGGKVVRGGFALWSLPGGGDPAATPTQHKLTYTGHICCKDGYSLRLAFRTYWFNLDC